MDKLTREPRDSKVPLRTFLTPFDATKFGSSEDPCFGKLYNLSEIDCQECGDHEVCAIAFAQHQKLRRAEEESNARFKDLEEEEIVFKGKIKDYIKKLRDKGKGDVVIKILAAKKFNKDKSYIKNLM